MTNYILTTGVSVLSNLRSGKGLRTASRQSISELIEQALDGTANTPTRDLLAAYVKRQKQVDSLEKSHLLAARNPLSAFRGARGTLEELNLPSGWDTAELSAEGASLLAVSAQDGVVSLDQALRIEDEVHLLASDTEEGLLAATLVAWLLAKRIEICRVNADGADPAHPYTDDQLSGVGTVGTAHVSIIDGLKANDASSFERAMGALGTALGGSISTNTNNIVLLSGGYKAVPPYVVACCEYLRHGLATVSAHIKFENGDGLLDLQLRSVHDGWREVLEDIEQGATDPLRDPSGPLHGWAYDRSGLTGFGQALLHATDAARGNA